MKTFNFNDAMSVYDYRAAVKSDLIDFCTFHRIPRKKSNFDRIYDDAFVSDAVTGNASGSYWCNRFRAERCLMGNWDLLKDALSEFCAEIGDPEYNDVTIRCYLLGECLSEILK